MYSIPPEFGINIVGTDIYSGFYLQTIAEEWELAVLVMTPGIGDKLIIVKSPQASGSFGKKSGNSFLAQPVQLRDQPGMTAV